MQLHNLQPKTKFRTARRIGRGGKRGKTSGRGTKGMGARAGAKFRPAEREILKKIPKLRGYRFKSFRSQPAVVNIYALNEVFKDGDMVSPETLFKAGLIRRVNGRIPEVKILGTGDPTKKLLFKSVIFSKSAKEKLT